MAGKRSGVLGGRAFFGGEDKGEIFGNIPSKWLGFSQPAYVSFSGVCSFMDLSLFFLFFLDGWEVVEGLFLGGRFEPIGYCMLCVF